MSRILPIISIFILSFFGCATETTKPKRPVLLVSIAPYKFIVEQMVGNTVDVTLLVPSGSSPHTYEPTPRQMVKASQADLWFRIGEGFEARLVPVLKSQNMKIQIIDLREGLDLIHVRQYEEEHCYHPDCVDPHVWLSPRLVKNQAEKISEVLLKTYPEHRQLYKDNLRRLLQQLDELDREISRILDPLVKRTIMVSHSAYAYFCRDYNLTQLAIEIEGKDPTPLQITQILQKARENNIEKIFVQTQHRSKGTRLIADEIGASVVELDPLSGEYILNMRHIARSIAK